MPIQRILKRTNSSAATMNSDMDNSAHCNNNNNNEQPIAMMITKSQHQQSRQQQRGGLRRRFRFLCGAQHAVDMLPLTDPALLGKTARITADTILEEQDDDDYDETIRETEHDEAAAAAAAPVETTSSTDKATTRRSSSVRKSLLKFATQQESLRNVVSATPPASDADVDGNNSEKKKVGFSRATIHYHGSVLGDNPSVSNGMPLALGNTKLHQETVDLLAVEEQQEQQEDDEATTANSRSLEQQTAAAANDDAVHNSVENPLIIPAHVRRQRLLDAGVTQSDMALFWLRQKIAQLPSSCCCTEQKAYLQRLEQQLLEQQQQQEHRQQ